MTKCSFCGKEEYAFRGMHVIKNDGSVSYFCSSKCRTNALKLKRDRRKLKWTEAYRIAREKAKAQHGREVFVEEPLKKEEKKESPKEAMKEKKAKK